MTKIRHLCDISHVLFKKTKECIMNDYTVLICDDKEAVHESLTRFLNDEGIHVISVYDGEAVLSTWKQHEIDLIILDIMLPNMNGTEICRTIRRESEVPIIFLSARSEEIDRIIGLELGGDDYVTKPFSPREVSLRVKKILSRSAKAQQLAQDAPQQNILHYQELSVNLDTMEVLSSGEKLDMTAKEVHLLAYLIRNAQKVLNREQILKAVWGYDYYGETRTLDVHIRNLRKKIGDDDAKYIETIRGVGYKIK